MKMDFGVFEGAMTPGAHSENVISHIRGETDLLTDVILCPPPYLAPVPCCAVTRQNLRQGLAISADEAMKQHENLVMILKNQGVRCHLLNPYADLPDMCFTRDIGVSTPWGMTVLNPAMLHRQGEVDALMHGCDQLGIEVRRISRGTIEGGDICIAREGLLIIGMSGERSSAAGVEEFASPFRAAGWEVLVCPFHADYLHLDTIFCMVDQDEAIGCVNLLDPRFLEALHDHGISIHAMPDEFASSLGCNILALGGRRIVSGSADDLVVTTLRGAGYEVVTLDISQFTACGGGVHCLTQPLRRIAA